MLLTLLMSIAMSMAVIIVHYWVLRAITIVSRRFTSHFWMSFTVVACLFLVHLFEIIWYASHLYVLYDEVGVDGFSESFLPVWSDYFHLAASGYTTLGLVSPSPIGALAVALDFISLTGFMMLTWSATYYYNIFSNSHAPTQR